MASPLLVSTTATQSTTLLIPKLSISNHYSNTRCPNLIAPFVVSEAASLFLVNTLKNLQPTVRFFQQSNTPLVVCFTSIVARAHGGNDTDGNSGESIEQNTYDLPVESQSQDDGVVIEIEKTGKTSRRIRSKVAVQASLQTVWDVLTDYEGLADFIPSLAVSQLLEKGENFARVFQVGEQSLAFGLKFNAKGTIDCFEKDLQNFPSCQKRDIEFKMIEGDFQQFEGKWSVEQEMYCGTEEVQTDSLGGQEFQTTLLYVVDVKPKLWLPVGLIEGRLCREIRSNLSCLREAAEKAFRNAHCAEQ